MKDIQIIDYSWGEINFEYRPMNGNMMKCCTAPTAAESYDLDIEPDDISVSDTVTVEGGGKSVGCSNSLLIFLPILLDTLVREKAWFLAESTVIQYGLLLKN